MTNYFDINKKQITAEEFNILLGQHISKRRLAKTKFLNGFVVSSVWTGIDVFGDGCIFETMVFDENGETVKCMKSSSKDGAYVAHVNCCLMYGMTSDNP